MNQEYRKHFVARGEFVLEIQRTPASVGRKSLIGSYVSIGDDTIFKVTNWDNSRMSDMHYTVEFADGTTSRVDDAFLSDAVRAGRLRNVMFRTISVDKFIELLTNATNHALGFLMEDIEERGGKRSGKKYDEADTAFIRDLLGSTEGTAGDPEETIEALRSALAAYAQRETAASELAPGARRRDVEKADRRRGRAKWIASVIDSKASAPPNPEARERAVALVGADQTGLRPRG